MMKKYYYKILGRKYSNKDTLICEIVVAENPIEAIKEFENKTRHDYRIVEDIVKVQEFEEEEEKPHIPPGGGCGIHPYKNIG